MRPFPGFVGPSSTAQSKISCDDRTVNWIPAKIESGTGPATYVFDPAPGFSSFADTSSEVGRGAFTLNGVSYVVFDDDLYQLPIFQGGTPTLLASGLNNPDDSPVTMAGNGDGGHQVMITSGSALYVYDVTAGTLTLIPDIQATFVVFIDGYFVALNPNRSEFRLSDLEDGSVWNPLDVYQRNDQPDKWIALTVSHKELWLFGSQTTSVYYNSGDAATPFVPNPSVSIARGIRAPNSIAMLNGSPIWLADDLTVRFASGYTPQRISTHAVEFALASMATVLDAEGSTYTEQGHLFYVLDFPAAQQTWVYDLTSGLWHERGVWDGLSFQVRDVRACINAQGLNLVLSRTGSEVYEQSQAFYTETDGVTGLCRERRAPHLIQTQNRIRYSHLRLLMESGIGLPFGQGSDPKVMLDWSDDGGQSFGAEYLAAAGPIGAYGILVDWWQLGQGRDRVFRMRTSDPWPPRLVTAWLDFSEGPS